MRLYKMELYKICSKKLFIFSAAAALVILLLYFNSFIISSESTINGTKYTGYQAIVMDREITEEFKGVLTDEKVERIVAKYGFPNGVDEEHNDFLYKNYLNDFVMRELSDGYFRGWNDYHVATRTYPIAESDLGIAGESTGKTVILEYSTGWKVFCNVMELGCIMGIILILLALSPVFSEEGYMNTQQILFTTKEGKTKDITAKIMAAMTIAVGVYVIFVILLFLLVGCVFGFDGLDCFYSQVAESFFRNWNNYNNISTAYMKNFICYAVFSCFLGMVEAAAVSLYFSAHCKSPFQSVIVSAFSLFAPVFLNILGRSNFNGILFIASQLLIVFLLGMSLMCFIPDISNRLCSQAARLSVCVLPTAIALFFRRKFPFCYAAPVYMIIQGSYSDLDIFQMHYPWIRKGVFLFAAIATGIFIVCSRRKYVK